MKLLECVPNFSEGRRKEVIDRIVEAIDSVEGITLLDVEPGAATNRTVVTFVGEPEAVVEAAFRGIKTAAELIDMRQHKGEHPRIGAADVCPFVPVTGITIEEAVKLAHQLAKRVWEELKIPVYLYEYAATCEERKKLENIREGQYEGLPQKLKDPRWKPDYGEPVFNPKSGATVIGVRDFLIAYNINLNTKDRRLAHEIALNIRERGRLKRDAQGNIVRDEQGNPIRVPGRLKAVKAVGWYIEEYGCAQVSINLTNYKITPLYKVFETVCEEAQKLGLRVTGSEIVGLVPKEAIIETGKYFLRKQGKSAGYPEEELIEIAIKSLGLNEVADFNPDEKIIEYRVLKKRGPLMEKKCWQFINEVSMDTPTPGGGSVSALCGALSSALTAMVGNLTCGKKGYENVAEEISKLAEKAQELKDKCQKLVDEDTEAFNKVMDAMRLPKKTEEQKKYREEKIEEATKLATEVPLKVMKTAREILKVAKEIGEKGMKEAISDIGVASACALTAAEGAYLNVLINLPNIKDEEFKKKVKDEANKILKEVRDEKEKLYNFCINNIQL